MLTALILVGGFGFLAFCVVLFYLRKVTIAEGRTYEQLKAKEISIDQFKKSEAVRNRMRRDPAYAKRMLDKYSRD
jgi:hypothetical protein